jgi:hypothetical protein
MAKKLTYTVLFNVEQVTPDPREYNQQRQLFKPSACAIVVELEITKENFYLPKKYFEKLKLWELGQGDKPETEHLNFTPLGWKRVIDLLEEPYKEENVPWDEDEEFESLYKE